VKFARWHFTVDAHTAADIVQKTLERVIEKGAYLKYQVDEDRGARAPRWLLKAVQFTGLADRRAERRLGKRDRRAARESLTANGLKVDVAKGADHEAGERAELEVGDARRDGWAVVDDMIADEEPVVDPLAPLPDDLREILLDVYGRDMTWADAAKRAGEPVERLKKRAQRAIAKLRASR